MKKVKVGKSKIHGNGLFADEPIKRGDVIELVHTMRELEPGVMKTTPTLLGRNYNHSDDSNALNVVDGNNRYLIALKEIEVGGEITTDYKTNPELEQPGSFASNDNYISFDYDDTLTTPEGFKLAQQMNKEGKNLYVITARDKVTPQMIERAEAAGIPKENIITAGSDEAKVKIVKENNISKHIDNKESVIKALGDTGELFSPDAYPDLKADFIEMDLTTDDLNKLQEGGFIVEESPDKGIITQEEIDAANNAMMKARLAYAYMHGNPAAQRMVVAPDQPYDFGNGMTGTHYMASMDNYAVPQIQDVNGQLMLGDYGPESAEAIRFDSDEDANYFAENYKDISPAFLNQQQEGGERKKRKKDSKGRYRSEDGNIRTPLTPEMQAVMPAEEWGQYVQEVPEVYTTRTREQQDIKNALDYQNRMAELYPGMPTQSDAIQPADWFWQLGMLGAAEGLGKSAIGAAESLGSRALPYVEGALNTSIPGMASIPGATVGNALGAGFAADAMVNRIPEIPGQLLRREYGDAAANVITSGLDIASAGLVSPIYQGAKSTASELARFLGTEEGLLSNAYKYNPLAGKLNEYNRVVGEDAILDLQNSGLVRAGKRGGVETNMGIRTSAYPSFGKGLPKQRYIDQTIQQGKSPYIISTNRPMGVSTLGRHGKGSTMLPIDETGKYMSAFSADDVKVFGAKPNWLRGYKEVPKELPGSPNGTLAYRNVTPSRVRSTNTGLTNADIDKEVANNIKWITSPEYARRRAANTGESLQEIQKSVDNIIKDADKAKFNLNSNPWIADLYERSGVMKSKTWLRPAKVEVSASAEQPIQTLNHEIKHLYSPSIYNQNKLYDNYPTLGDAADDYLGIGAEQQVRHLNAREQILAENNLPIDAQLSEEQVREFVDGWGSRMNKMNKTNDFSSKEDFDAIWNDEAAKIQKEMLMARYNTDDLSFISKLPTSQKVKFISEYRDRLTRSITDALNKAWITVPIAGGVGLNNLETSEQRYGGSISKLSKFIR